MDFLKEILGDELFNQIVSKINEHNGNEANKDNQVKIGNLATGKYTDTGKYNSLQEILKGKETELQTANDLIADLKKGTKDNEGLQQKITTYEGQVQALQEELAETKINSAVKVALLSAKVTDVDYLTWKLTEQLKEKGEKLELDDNDNIKNWNSYEESLRTQFPKWFESGGSDGGYEPLGGQGLPNGKEGRNVTKEQFKSMSYEERLAIKQSNEKEYQNLRG